MRLQDFSVIASSLLERMGRASKAPGNLKESSPWLRDFRAEALRDELEVPGELACGDHKAASEGSPAAAGALHFQDRAIQSLLFSFLQKNFKFHVSFAIRKIYPYYEEYT